jgi:UDP-N-acetylglucosamine--N-acetylmuramyl-(pentapeptide) pyrophosphoryl-undecaprenol N-acetylglucosamine transferase
MTIVVTGGGSGGHITPILAVAAELKKLQPDIRIVYVGQRGDGLADIPAQDSNIDEAYSVRAGKFRRYHGEGLKQLLDVPTMLKNLRDAFYVLIGIWQSFWLLGKLKPEVIFVKGGFVGVPVGLAAAVRHIPFITHDSDALPGLANRIIARWATLHAVALPKEVYSYPLAKTVTVGVPVQDKYVPLNTKAVQQHRRDLGLAPHAKVVLITGGGLGAQRLNEAVATILPDVLDAFPDLTVIQTVGRMHQGAIQRTYEQQLSPGQKSRVVVKGYVSDLYRYSGAADVIITRAGATAIAEFAVQGKACILVPNPILTGGHQLKNAQVLADKGAVVVVPEADLKKNAEKLKSALTDLLADPLKQAELGHQLAAFARPGAAKELAVLLLEQAQVSK